ncbi:glycosyltransferase family 9 protein [bacterium]|nr:glycosyltransferase family 9 protein [bacterium]
MNGQCDDKPVFWIVHLGGLGDWVLTWPVIQTLRRRNPETAWVGIGKPDFMRLAVRFGILDCWMDGLARNWIPFYDGTGFPDGVRPPDGAILWMQENSGPVRFLKRNPSMPLAVVDPIPHNPESHISRIYAESISGQTGLPGLENPFSGFPVHEPASHYSLIHPGSGGIRKCLDPGFYSGLFRLLLAHGFDKTAYILGPAEIERGLRDAFATLEWICPDSVSGLADWLSNAALYIGNDSGVSHLAAFMGIPSIVLYTVTDPAVWGASGRRVLHIRASHPAEAERAIAGALDSGFAGTSVTAETRFSP